MNKKTKLILGAVGAVIVVAAVVKLVVPAVKSSNFFIKSRDVGDTIVFGSYEKDNYAFNGKEDLEWVILDKQDDKMLIMTKECVDAQIYNSTKFGTDGEFVNWGTCELRPWLNDTFFNEAFSAKEKLKVLTSTVSADVNTKHESKPGADTEDKVFCLSVTEAEKYFTDDEARMAAPSMYCTSCLLDLYGDEGSYDGGGSTAWFLRTPGTDDYSITYVTQDGEIDYEGQMYDYKKITLRPAVWISIK